MPGLNGFDVLESVRACGEIKSLPIVVMSGSTNDADIERSYELGANSYILKGTRLQEILNTGSQLVSYWSKCARLPHLATHG